MKSIRTLLEWSVLSRSCISIIKTRQELWENPFIKNVAPWHVSKINLWQWYEVIAPKAPHWLPHELRKYPSELHDFFRVSSPSLKLHDFCVDSLSNCMKLCKLSSELHGKRHNKMFLILIRTIRCFWVVQNRGSSCVSRDRSRCFGPLMLELPHLVVQRSPPHDLSWTAKS